jgi:ferritin-like metal-binding protein YciE
MANNKDLLVRWLNDAYAMEHQLLPVLENHAKDVKNNPPAQQRIRQHIDETKRHAERMEQCVKRLGASPSTTKSTLASLMGSAQAISTGMFRDEIVKNALSDYAAEQFEVACYKALISAAQEHGEPEIVRACEENMREDEAMARWLDQQLPGVVHQVLQPAGTAAR